MLPLPPDPREDHWELEAGVVLQLVLKVAQTIESTSPGSVLSPLQSYDTEAGAVASKDDISEAEIDSAEETADWAVTALRKMTIFTLDGLVSAVAEAQGHAAGTLLHKMADHFLQKPTALDEAWADALCVSLDAAELMKLHAQLRSKPKIQADDLDEDAVRYAIGNSYKPKEGATPEEIAKAEFSYVAGLMNLTNTVERLRAGMKIMDRLVTAKVHLKKELNEVLVLRKNNVL